MRLHPVALLVGLLLLADLGAAPKTKSVAQLADDEADETPAPAPKAKAKAVAVEEDEEPTVRKEEKKPSAVPGKKSLADVVGAWDDED
jgi:hypothetical protein